MEILHLELENLLAEDSKMVQIFERGPSKGALQSQILGQGIGQGAGAIAGTEFKRARTNSALDEISGIANQEGANPLDILVQFYKAFNNNPEALKNMPQLAPQLMQMVNAKNASKAGLPGDQEESRMRELERKYLPSQMKQEVEQNAQFQLPQFGQQQGQPITNDSLGSEQYHPTNMMKGGAPGNVPQTATAGEKKPVYSPGELSRKAHELVSTRAKSGIFITPSQAFEEIKNFNDENKLYNKAVEEERQERISSQQESGQAGIEALLKAFPQATPEEQSIFAGKAEELRRDNPSEAAFSRALAVEADKFKDNLVNIEADISAPRSYNRLHRMLNGNDKDIEAATKDLRVKLKPLHDLGLYDRERAVMTKAGYYPEEVDHTINPLSDRDEGIINRTPRPRKKYTVGGREEYLPNDRKNLRESISEIMKDNPRASLVLVRKGLEKKGYDWRAFKDELNDLISKNEVKLNDDQMKQIIHLDSPPLTTLEKLAEGLKLIGR